MTGIYRELGKEDLIRRAERLQRELETWTATAADDPGDLFISPTCFRAIVKVVGNSLDDLENRVSRLKTSLPDHMYFSRFAELQSAVVQAEKNWEVFSYVVAQRRDRTRGEVLQLADLLASDCFDAILQNSKLQEEVAPPLVVLQPLASPLTFNRSTLIQTPGTAAAGRIRLPLPLIVVPPDHLECAWLLTTVLHEAGHNIDHLLNLSSRIQPAIASNLAPCVSDRVEQWKRCTEEIVADAIAILLGGEGVPLTFSLLCHSVRMQARDANDDPHPPAPDRLALFASLLEHVFGKAVQGTCNELRDLADSLLKQSGRADGFSRLTEESGRVAQAVLETEHPLLSCKTLRQLAAAEDNVAAYQALATKMTGSPPHTSDNWVAVRLVPTAAQLACVQVDEMTPAVLARIHEHAKDIIRSQVNVEWVIREDRWKFLADLVPQIEPPILNEMGEKEPPVELLKQHKRIVFVGASNDQLDRMIAKVLDADPSHVWELIEVFFLDDQHLTLTASPQRPPDLLVELKKAAIEQLRRRLPQVTRQWGIFEYSFAPYFASYWDWDAQGGRIHVSPYIWGQTVRTAPAIDYIWERDEPTEQYKRYILGLEGLRKHAQLLYTSQIASGEG